MKTSAARLASAREYKRRNREIPKPQKVGPFNEPATFKGELVRLEGEDDTKHAGLKDAQGRLWSGDMDRELAVEMRNYMFEWVLVDGIARWLRNDRGEWELKAFHIRSCKPLPKDSLEDDIKALRKIPGNQWRTLKDPLSVIRESRSDDDEIALALDRATKAEAERDESAAMSAKLVTANDSLAYDKAMLLARSSDLQRMLKEAEDEREEMRKALDHNLAVSNKAGRHAMAERDQAIRSLRKTYSAIEIASMTCLTRQRVHQILNEDDAALAAQKEKP